MEALSNPRLIQLALIELIALILSITVHEFGHAIVADKLGDSLPRSQGRVTLNPLAHIDFVGTIIFPLLAFFAAASGSALSGRILGWGKPVYTSPRAHFVRGMRHQTADLLISIAGPGMNVLFAAVLSLVFLVLLRTGGARFAPLVGSVIAMNIGLALFNLIPCPPLDGRSLLFWFLPDRHPVVQFLTRYGQFIFLMLLMTGGLRLLMIPVGIVTDLWLDQLSRWSP